MATEFHSHENVASEAELKVSAYDKVASLLIALVIVVGFFVLLMLAIWLTGSVRAAKVSIPVQRLEDEGRGDHAPGFALDPEEPGMEEMEQLKEPQIEDTLQVVQHMVANQTSALAAIESNAALTSRGIDRGNRQRIGPPGRPKVDGIIPRHERWEIRFLTSGIETYARQLDFFKIELGAVGGGSAGVDYACNLSKPIPDRRSGDSEDEDRLYMSWQNKGGPMSGLDRQLLARAGIDTQRRSILQFYSKEIEDSLSNLETQAARHFGHTDPRAVVKTVFGVRSVRDGYAFFIIEQHFRPVPES